VGVSGNAGAGGAGALDTKEGKMSFMTDKQTLNDLHIFGRRDSAIYNLFNKTQTRGGAQVLEELFMVPLSDNHTINRRSAIIQYFRDQAITFPFRNEAFDAIEHYLENTDERTKLNVEEDNLKRKLRNYMGADTEYEGLHNGLIASIEVINGLHNFLQSVDPTHAPAAWQEEMNKMQLLLADDRLTWMYNEKGHKKLAYEKVATYDQVLRFAAHDTMKKLLYYIYQLDVYIAVARVAMDRHFTFAQALDAKENTLYIVDMVHPHLANAVPNTIQVDRNSNVIFLTGANMAGKSTFMKTLGITILLAHMGFPVPATHMEFTVQNGLFTTINLADDLNRGYSHFYAEVLRLKKVAEHVSRTEKLVIIFDELFRGTNVKDAYDATIAVTAAFTEKRNCTFIISTHIIEAGEVLQEQYGNINFVYFPTTMNGNIPAYTYRLQAGITNDRHGMMIINNENIIGIIKSRQHTQKLN
jgi:DNA mismatch repair protein MutS